MQVGDPFTEKCLIEACLELMATDAVVGIQDMGAAGLTCSSFEMASLSGTGIALDLDAVPQRETGMIPYELLLSESQERMLLVAQAGREEEVAEIFRRWDLDVAVVGRVTDDGRMRIQWKGETVVDIPVDPVAKSSPELDRPVARPADLGERQKLDLASVAPEEDFEAALSELLGSPNLGSKEWIYRQYDQLVQGDTVIRPGGDAALVRVRDRDGDPTAKGLAMSVDCNPRWCWLDPHVGAMAAVAEAARNVACTGARPLALTNCLNFGSPERPEIMWEFAEATRGISEAAVALETPVVSGNVSFYNETSGRAIYPTPTIGVVGLLENWERHAVSHFPAARPVDRAARRKSRGARRQRVARAAARPRGGPAPGGRSRARKAPPRPARSRRGARPDPQRSRRFRWRARGGVRGVCVYRARTRGCYGSAYGYHPARRTALWENRPAGSSRRPRTRMR